MTSAEYRERAEKLLTKYPSGYLEPGALEQAAVWAQLANAAAITEAAQAAIRDIDGGEL